MPRRRPRPRDLTYASRGFGSLTANADPSYAGRLMGTEDSDGNEGIGRPGFGQLGPFTRDVADPTVEQQQGQPTAATFSHRKAQLLHRWADDTAAAAAAAAAVAAAGPPAEISNGQQAQPSHE